MSPDAAKKPKMSSLEQLKKLTTVVADTGDFEGEFSALNKSVCWASLRSESFRSR